MIFWNFVSQLLKSREKFANIKLLKKEGSTMIIVNSPIMQKQIIKVVEAISDPKFTYQKTDGIRIYFNTEAEDKDEACKIVKAAIKKDPMGGALVLTVKSEEYI